jgi:hypothetical protein
MEASNASLRPHSQWRRGWEEGLQAARSNLRPALVLLTLTIALVLGYELWPLMRTGLNQVVEARERVGLIFGILSTAAFGGALPLVFRRFLLAEVASPREVVFGVCFWAYKGLEVTLLYDFQAYLWGSDNDLTTIVTKTLVDQLIYAPLIAVPNMTLGYLWFECGYSLQRTRQALREKSFISRALPVLISNAMVWIPAISLVYMLPTALQLPVSNLVLTFWVLILMIVARRQKDATEAIGKR